MRFVSATRLRWVLALTAVFLLVAEVPAHAYIDPGSGSYVFQILVGALAGAAVTMKLFWRRIVAFVTRGRSRKG